MRFQRWFDSRDGDALDSAKRAKLARARERVGIEESRRGTLRRRTLLSSLRTLAREHFAQRRARKILGQGRDLAACCAAGQWTRRGGDARAIVKDVRGSESNCEHDSCEM